MKKLVEKIINLVAKANERLDKYIAANIPDLSRQMVQKLIEEHKANVRKAIDAGWNGESAERFKELFNKRCDELSEALKAEYYDLESRLNELTTNYINQDKNMIIE